MPCEAEFFSTKDGSSCHIRKKYIESGEGGQHYHGELCNGCPWWVDSPEDKEVKEKRRGLESKGNTPTLQRS